MMWDYDFALNLFPMIGVPRYYFTRGHKFDYEKAYIFIAYVYVSLIL